jgi:hypothetical protein
MRNKGKGTYIYLTTGRKPSTLAEANWRDEVSRPDATSSNSTFGEKQREKDLFLLLYQIELPVCYRTGQDLNLQPTD